MRGCCLLAALSLLISVTTQAQDAFTVTGAGSFWGRDGQVPTGSVKVTVKKNGVAVPNVDVQLQSDDQADRPMIATSRMVTDVSGTATFDKAEFVRHGAYASASEQVIHLHALVGDQSLPLTGADLHVIAPQNLVITSAYNSPRKVVAGAPSNWVFQVRADDGLTMPVRDVSVRLDVPDATSSRTRKTNEVGEVTFEDVRISAAPRSSKSVVASLTTGDSKKVSVELDLVPGDVDSLAIRTSITGAYRVGEPFAITLVAKDRYANPAVGAVIRLSLATSGGYIGFPSSSEPRNERKADEQGLVTFDDLFYHGPVGDVRLSFSAGVTTKEISVPVIAGTPREIVELEPPPTTIRADSLITPAPKLRVQDAAGNPIKDAMLRARICQLAPSGKCTFFAEPESQATALWRQQSRSKQAKDAYVGQLLGTRIVQTNAAGEALFDALKFVGPSGPYALVFDLPQLGDQSMRKTSTVMYYDGDVEFNRNFVIISAIKSVAGSKPSDEFFDIRFRFRLLKRLTGMVYSDLALTRTDLSDTASANVTSSQRRLVDASFQLNGEVIKEDPQRSVPERARVAGAHFRIFNTVPYVGLHVGSVELARSVFHGSSLSLGYSVPLDRTPVKFDGGVMRPSKENLLVDGFVRSSNVGFFEFLNIRVGLLIPLRDKGRRPISRIVLAVPIGKLISF